jgi:NitT/TauT family transport system substrate-binding protein
MKRFLTTTRRLLALAGLAALLAGQAAIAQAERPVAVADRVVLLVDEIHALRNFPVVLADKLGYLKNGNMAVTVMNVRYDVSHADMLADGRVDAVMAYYHHNVVNQAQGRPSQAIVTLGVTPGMKVMVAAGARERFKTTADLKGAHFISGGAGSAKTTLANGLVLAGGHALADYNRQGSESKDANVEALRSGTADLVVAPIPDDQFYESRAGASVFADLTSADGTKKALGTLFPSSTVFMASERVAAHPEMAQHLADAFVRTLKFINSHSAEEIAALIPPEIKGKDNAAYLRVLKEQMRMFANDGSMPADGAQKELKLLAEANPKYKGVVLEQTYTNRFVTEALKKYR